jgi:hypothetical protein
LPGNPRALPQNGTSLGASDTLVVQDPDYDPPVLGLSFCRLIVTYVADSHRLRRAPASWLKRCGLLLEKLPDIVGPIFTQLRVQCDAAN